MAYLISEEAQDLLQDVKNFCDKEVVEQCKAYDVSGEWPKEIYDKAIEQGYQALEVPEEFGGPGLSRVDVAAIIEQMDSTSVIPPDWKAYTDGYQNIIVTYEGGAK